MRAAVDAGQLEADTGESRLLYHIELLHLLAHCVAGWAASTGLLNLNFSGLLQLKVDFR